MRITRYKERTVISCTNIEFRLLEYGINLLSYDLRCGLAKAIVRGSYLKAWKMRTRGGRKFLAIDEDKQDDNRIANMKL